MKYLSLFSGIGGFELGIRQAYESNNEYASLSEESKPQERQEGGVRTISINKTQLHNRDRTTPLCVGYSEIDRFAIQVYEKHFPDHKNFGDITKIRTDELPEFDLLVGGFPCQAFSIAGKRRGFEDTRGTLFFEIARILRDKRPRYFLLENVKGLLSHDSGKTFQTILGVLTDIGYEYQWQVLNSKNFGVPQNRERVFIIGNIRGEPRPQVFPIGKANENNTQSPQELREQNSNTLRTNYGGATSNETYIAEIRQMNNPIHSNDRIYSPEGISPTLNTAQGGNRQPFIALSPETCYIGSNDNATKTRPDKALQVLSEVDNKTEIQQRRADVATSLQKDAVLQSGVYEKGLQGSLQNGQAQVDGGSLQGKANFHEVGSMRDLQRAEENGDTPQRPQRDKQQPTKSSGAMSGLPHEATSDKSPKNLIPQEAEKRSWAIRRLTPLEAERLQGFPDSWTDILSDTQRYKTLGNAVTVNVVEEIIKRLF